MIIAFQIILLLVILSSFNSVISGKDKSLQEKMLTVFLASLAAFVVSVLWL